MVRVHTRFSSCLERVDQALDRRARWLVALFAASFTAKLAYVLQSADSLHVTVPIMDSAYYQRMADGILRGKFVQDSAFFMGPLYPYVLAGIFSVFGKSIMAARIIQVGAGSLTVVLTYLLGRRLFRPSTAMLGALLLLFYGATTFYEGQLLMMWLGTLLNTGFLLVLCRMRENGRKYALAGVLLGMSALARANVLVLVAVVVVWLVFVSKPMRRWAHAAVFLIAVTLTLLPATIHNYAASRDFVPITSNGGVNFYVGNNAGATGIFAPPKGINLVSDSAVKTYVQRLLGRKVTDSELSRYWFGEAFRFIRHNPGRELRLMLRKTAMFFNGYEVPQIESYEAGRNRHSVLRLLFVSFWALVSLGLFGMICLVREWRRYFLIYGYVISFSFSIILFFVTARYRVQITPVLCLFAAYALLSVVPRALAAARRSLVPLGVLILIILVTRPALFALPADEVMWREHTHQARRLSRAGRYADALKEIDKAVNIRPDTPDSYLQRAVIYKAQGKHFEAISDYSHALAIQPEMPSVQYDLGQSLRAVRMYEPAVEAYKKAIELNPRMLEAYNNLGITYRELKRYGDAVTYFQHVIRMDPEYTKAYNNLGATLAEAGEIDRAIDTFRKAIAVDSSYASTYKNLAMAYIQKKNVRKAADALTRYLSMNPKDRRAQAVMEKLNIVLDSDSLEGEPTR